MNKTEEEYEEEIELCENSIKQCQAEIQRLRRVVRELNYNDSNLPFSQCQEVFGMTKEDENAPQKGLYVSSYHNGHVIELPLKHFLYVENVYSTESEALDNSTKL